VLNDAYQANVAYNPSTFAYGLNLVDQTSGTTIVTSSQISGTVFGASASADYFNFGAHNQNSTVSNFSVTAAPEPSEATALLLGALFLGGAFAQRLRRRTG